ncbi:uncharacterized protein Z520_08798 [Fonsecaea multimorphosa CBS 102226]|uniref:F-box domain-containing protein n=1 Tax=Fonsecaea multimorphosa CBS 102226 TaxID=1442371 RepID=A0A0D2KG64_9EURO|nr:uncharacterized protein Z520_08798 [Fonsecaea multimorphosa CBS 102226]KIX95678.1 hypothetical protein Z520_08798 [Fonsecaea multimorphosa CBS 102226]
MSDQSPALRSNATAATLGTLPSEILQQIFYASTTPTFFQLLQINRRFFQLASQSREIILHHLREVPGLKLGLEHHSVPTDHLFLIFRQRAASHLYGVNFTADCRSWVPPPSSHSGARDTIDPRASCLGVESEWGNNVCLVLKNSHRVRMNWHHDLPGEMIESPYADGRAKIIQVVQKSHYITVLYAWTPPDEDPANDTSHPEPTTTFKASVKEVLEDRTATHRSSKYGRPSSSKHKQSKASSSLARVHYHLLHYDMFRNDRPLFFPIPTHKSIDDNTLVPVHLAVHNRLTCAILWDLPDTMTPSEDVTVCLYTADHLPRGEAGEYNVWVLYPYDRPTAIYRSSRSGDRIVDSARGNSDDNDVDGSGIAYTVTSVHQMQNRYGFEYDLGQDLRLVNLPQRPRALAFFHDGRRLSLYAPGSVVPFTTLLANDRTRRRIFNPMSSHPIYPSTIHAFNRLCRSVRHTSTTSIFGTHFALGLPFFSAHETTAYPCNAEPQDLLMRDGECVNHMLCLGTANLPTFSRFTQNGVVVREIGPQVLTIVQIRRRVNYNLCPHTRSTDHLPRLPRPPRRYRESRHLNHHLYPDAEPHSDITVGPPEYEDDDDGDDDVGNVDLDFDPEGNAWVASDPEAENLHGTDLRVAARLWGWAPQRTTLTGLDTISISPRGERIAVAQWDRVLVYALDPRALCDEAWDEDSDSDIAISEGESSPESSSESENDDHDDHVVQHAPPIPEHSPPVSNPAPIPSASAPPKAASFTSSTSTLLSFADLLYFYPHTNDGWPLERIVELRPIVLKMDGGAVVRKMSWALGKPVRMDDEEANDAGEISGKWEAAEGAADEMEGIMMVKETENEHDAGNVASTDDTARLNSQRPNAEGGRSDNSRASADVENFHPCDRQQPPESLQCHSQPLPKSDLQTDAFSKNTCTAVPEVEMSTIFHEIPPAPFSDTKLIGQIKYIARPTDHHSSTNKVALESPESTPSRPAVLDPVKGKEIEMMEASAEGRRDETHDTTTDHEHGASPVAEPSESGESEPWYKRKGNPRTRVAENELTVLTDRGLQVWDLSVWGRGRRIRCELPCDDILY